MQKSVEIIFLRTVPGQLLLFDQNNLNARVPIERPQDGTNDTSNITYLTYLNGIKDFLLDNYEKLLEIISNKISSKCNSIDKIEIIPEKHGSDYHPARVRIKAAGSKHSFVINTALTTRGKQRLAAEFDLLKMFQTKFTKHYTPKVWFSGSTHILDTEEKPILCAMFLGEWFDDFHEFHLSFKPNSDDFQLTLWDLERGFRSLSKRETHEIYKQIAFILTYYYDLETFEEIFPWHHASGDFIVRIDKEQVETKLIAVRQYNARAIFPNVSLNNRLQALLLFLANLTIRIRLDRIDGIGEIAWAGYDCLAPTLQGFLEALNKKAAESPANAELLTSITNWFKTAELPDFVSLFKGVSESYNEKAPDHPVIMNNLVDHIYETYSVIHSLTTSFIHSENRLY